MISRREWVLNGITALLVVWLAWLLLSAPTFTFPDTMETNRCQPIVGQIDAYRIVGLPTDSSKKSISDVLDFLDRQVPMNDPAESIATRERAERHAADVVIASCHEARTNRQTEAIGVMLVIAVAMMPRLSRIQPVVKKNAAPSSSMPGGGDD